MRLAVKREVDGAMDAFEVTLPVRNDRERRRLETFAQVKPDETISFPSLEEEARPGTVRQSMLLTYQPELVKMLSGHRLLGTLPVFLYGAAHQSVDA